MTLIPLRVVQQPASFPGYRARTILYFLSASHKDTYLHVFEHIRKGGTARVLGD
jgi:hypothetical protein